MRFNVKDFPEQGVSLILPSDPSIQDLQVTLPKSQSSDSYSVILKNTAKRAIVGYAVKWECFDARGAASDRDVSKDRNVSHLVSWVFLEGKESERKAAMYRSNEIIWPHSTWLISFDSPPRRLDVGTVTLDAGSTDEGGAVETLQNFSVTVTVDGIFFDDGTFVGTDTGDFFSATKSQMDARFEILQGLQSDLKSGKNADQIFTRLEKINRDSVELGDRPTGFEFRAYFRSMFARDLLGKKELWGADKTIEDVQRQLSKPWVYLRKL